MSSSSLSCESAVWHLESALERIAHWLPSQGPIKDFIHHNTLHAFQNRNFFEALDIASQVYGAKQLMPLNWYQEKFQAGQISESALHRIAAKQGISTSALPAWRENLMVPEDATPAVSQFRLRTLRAKEINIDLDGLVHPLVFRLLGSYLDQGISIWRMPHAHLSFWSAVTLLIEDSYLPFPPLTDEPCRGLLKMEPQDAIEACLKKIVGDPAFYESYLLETCLAHRGWSGMVAVLERSPGVLLAPRQISLQESLAVELIAELGWLVRHLGKNFSPLCQTIVTSPLTVALLTPRSDSYRAKAQVWQEALEWSLYEQVFPKLISNNRNAKSIGATAEVQAFFCLDDRECSVRRHLESVAPSVKTYGTAGFFGIDFLFQSAMSAHAFQYCPIALKPKHLVREKSAAPLSAPQLKDLIHLAPASNTLFRGWLLTQTLGISACLRLARNVLWPNSRLLANAKFLEEPPETELQLLRQGDSQNENGYWLGYSFEEMADRVANVLRSAGFEKTFSKLVVFVAHGASSTNNPHFAAYHCGACSGKRGAPNARAFAWMANHPEVRAHLEKRGVPLPSEIYFVGAIHDTTRDEIQYFDIEKIPASHQSLLREFQASFEQALDRNAIERCQNFELAPRNPSGKAARAHVQMRALSLFETRPEWNHANNALCIVGRRNLTRGLSLDRRAFLNSYDPDSDPQGEILSGILNAVVPVCGGINLEYFFSRVDNEIYGAGTKLPHNVVSLLGVANGVEGDLRTGLPAQMVEIHDPVRLMIIIEQEPEIVLRAATKNAEIFEWIKNDWVKLACLSPSQNTVFLFEDSQFTEMRTEHT